jgi:hypothetical protein
MAASIAHLPVKPRKRAPNKQQFAVVPGQDFVLGCLFSEPAPLSLFRD